MKIIVFGGSGFIGSHVADELTARGYKVKIYDMKKSPYLKEGQEMVEGDILDKEAVKKAIKGSDIVYNFAGIASLDDATTQPLKTVEQNILGNAYILEGCVEAKIKKFVYASTIYVYSALGGFYKCSKQASELYIEEYNKKYGLNFSILRYGTVYGPRADKKNSIYKYIRQALETGKITCEATGDEVREYIHVRDVAKLSVDAISDEFTNKHVIISGHNPIKARDMFNTIKEMLDNKVQIEMKPPSKDGAHYTMTPYSFIPKIGNKLVSNYYVDLGQGLFECMNEIKNEIDAEKKG